MTQAGTGSIGRVWQAAEASGLQVVAARMVSLSEEDASHVSAAVGSAVPAGPALAMQLMGDGSSDKAHALAGHAHERSGAPSGSVMAAVNEEATKAMLAGFFGDAKARMRSAKDFSGSFQDCACVLVLPTAFSNGSAGNILAEVQRAATEGGLSISGLRTTSFRRAQAEEYLEVYKAVVPEYVVSRQRVNRGAGWVVHRKAGILCA